MQKYSAWALGGIDSAVTALLYSGAIGKKNTKCVFLPDDATPDLDIKHQELFVKKFDLLCEKKDITSLVLTMESKCVVKPNDYALANIKARTRMILLFGYANMTISLVCGASNKSEMLVGYFTKYGDGGVDSYPICLDTKDPDEIIQAVKWLKPSFGGINLEDIAKPKCFYILDRLRKEMDIPV